MSKYKFPSYSVLLFLFKNTKKNGPGHSDSSTFLIGDWANFNKISYWKVNQSRIRLMPFDTDINDTIASQSVSPIIAENHHQHYQQQYQHPRVVSNEGQK